MGGGGNGAGQQGRTDSKAGKVREWLTEAQRVAATVAGLWYGWMGVECGCWWPRSGARRR
jgi:hypothetical protein